MEGKEWYLSKRQGLVRSGMGVGILAVEKRLKGTWLIRHPSEQGCPATALSQARRAHRAFGQTKPLLSRVSFDR